MSFIAKLSRWYFTKNALPYWCILLGDCLIIVGAGILVHLFAHGASGTLQHFRPLLSYWAVCLLPYIAAFRLFHTYAGVIRYSSFVDLQRIAFAMLLGTGIVLLMHLVLPWELQYALYRKSGLVIVCFLSIALMWTVRILVKFLYDTTYQVKQPGRVFIYGVREGGISLAKSLRNEELSRYVLDGFVTNDTTLEKYWMMGVRVFLNDAKLRETLKRRKVHTLMVSPVCSRQFREDTELIDFLIAEGIRILMLPPAREWDGKADLEYKSLKEVDIEDLLPREKIEINMEEVGKLLTNRKILVTGAAGSIGSEMVHQIAVYHPAELVLIDQAETPMHDLRLAMAGKYPEIKAVTIVASICNATRMEEIFRLHRPDYVFHAAAYKHVPMMEDNPSESVQNNIYGTRIVADLAVKYGTRKFVMISTDKAVNPTNVMGCSKRICEIYVQSLDRAVKSGKIPGTTQFVTTRFGNVLGSNGSVIPLFREQIRNGGPVTVTHPDIIRYFMLIPEACKLVLEAGTQGKGGEIFVFDMGKPVRIADLARRMILLSGVKDIEIKYTGLRDGEKLYEEVLNDAEITKPAFHPKIKIASVREYDYEEVRLQEERLREASFHYNDMEIVKIMKEIVPEFRSRHSKYEVLDN